MKPSSILSLYRARLRTGLVRELLAVTGIAVGVALLFASQVASTSLDGSVTELTSAIVGQMRYQVLARSPEGFDQNLLAQVQSLPGVQTAVPVLEQSVEAIGPSGRESVDLLGVDPRFVRLKRAVGAPLQYECTRETERGGDPTSHRARARRHLARAGHTANRSGSQRSSHRH